MPYHVVQPQVDCTTAEEFLDAISPLGAYFKNQKLNAPWLFRGQGTDKPLIPSLFRTDAKSKERLRLLTHHNIDKYEEIRLVEGDLITQFFEIADKRGLILPDDSQDLRIFFEKIKNDEYEGMVKLGIKDWRIRDKGLSIMALTQHYKIPTQLLDWTLNAFIAAFFAGEAALDNDPSERLVVWAFYFPALGKQDESSRLFDPISIITAPKATNTNLKAQQGVFTLLNFFYAREFSSEYTDQYYGGDKFWQDLQECEMPGNSNISKGNYPPLDVLFEKLAQMEIPLPPKKKELIRSCIFQKFTLPALEASRLLNLLAKYDVAPSTIYPGYHSIVSDIQMKNA